MKEAYVIPEPIQSMIVHKPYTVDQIGKSGSVILCYEDMVLKIESATPSFSQDIAMLRWLENRLPVPKVLATASNEKHQFLLMSRIQGKMACDREFTAKPEQLAQMLADVLRQLWRVDISHCPRQRLLQDDLAEARERIRLGLVDMEDTEPETFGPNGFASPQALLQWLTENAPETDPVFSHGDLCLPNIFFHDHGLSGLIDLGDCAVSDRWRDIALCYRSLHSNVCGRYAHTPNTDFHPDILFEKLGIEPDLDKLRYYMLLDELF